MKVCRANYFRNTQVNPDKKPHSPSGVYCCALLYQCPKCKRIGCDRSGCPNQVFEGLLCSSCGSVGTRKPL